MIEAEVTCLCRHVWVPDLELDLTRDQVVYLPKEKADGSADLTMFRRIRAVRVKYVQRTEHVRPAAPQPPPPVRRQPVRPPVIQAPVVAPPPAVSGFNLAQLEALLARRDDMLKAEIAQVVGDVIAGKALGTPLAIPGEPVASGTVPVEDSPVFIPQGLVRDDVKAEIKTESTTTDGAGVTDAAEALRKARKGRKGRKE